MKRPCLYSILVRMLDPLKIRRVFFGALLAGVLLLNSYGQDGSKHVTFDAGAGFSFPVGQLENHSETGFNFVASGGARFNSRLSLSLDFAIHYSNVENSLHSAVTGVDFRWVLWCVSGA